MKQSYQTLGIFVKDLLKCKYIAKKQARKGQWFPEVLRDFSHWKFTENCFISRKNEFYVYTSDTHALDRLDFPSSVDQFHPRGSIKSLRKGSYDIRSLNSDGKCDFEYAHTIIGGIVWNIYITVYRKYFNLVQYTCEYCFNRLRTNIWS